MFYSSLLSSNTASSDVQKMNDEKTYTHFGYIVEQRNTFKCTIVVVMCASYAYQRINTQIKADFSMNYQSL